MEIILKSIKGNGMTSYMLTEMMNERKVNSLYINYHPTLMVDYWRVDDRKNM